jgi:hypothetical protein
MSIQLIVFPQTYNGQYNVIAMGSGNNMASDSQLFLSASGAIAVFPSFNFPAIGILNTPAFGVWQRFKVTGGVQSPFVTAGVLKLPGENTVDGTGVYQRITGLNIGTVYELNLNFANSTTGQLTMAVYDGATQVSINYSVTNVAAITPISFTATNTTCHLIIAYTQTGVNDICDIENLILFEQGQSPSFTTNILSDGQVILDLYEDENIPLTLSIDDFKNAAEKVQSYSKAFKVPATKRNNKIFDNVFEITRADDGVIFNPYVRTQALLKQDGFTLFEGYLRLIDITEKNGETSYNINLYSEAIALADVLGNLEFSDLDFTELDHDYEKIQIKVSWNDAPLSGITWLNPANAPPFFTSSFRNNNDTVKYPFVDWTHQMTVADGSGTPIANMPELGSLEQVFRPFIQVKYLIDRIFNQGSVSSPFPFSYTSAFFNTVDFKKLYMDFNWGSDNAPVVFNSLGDLTKALDFNIPLTYTTLPFDEMNYGDGTPLAVGGNPLDANFGYSAGVFTAQEDGQVLTVNYAMLFNRSILSDTIEVQWLVNGAPVDYATSTSPFLTYSGSFTTGVGGIPTLSAGDTVLCQAKSGIGTYELDGVLDAFNPPATPSLITVTTSLSETTNETLLQTLRGELGQWEFLKGIMTMFNLVAIPDKSNPSNIIIEPYSDVFINNTAGTSLKDRSIAHDWTDKIDLTQIKLKPLTDLDKKTIFKFVEDDDDYAFQNYKNSVNGHLYGSKVYDASGFTILDGTKDIEAEPFAATVVKPLMPLYGQLITPAIYSYNPDDGTSEGFENSPRIMYNNGIVDLSLGGSTSYYIPPQNGGTSENATTFLQFSHLSAIPPVPGTTVDFNFGECQLVPSSLQSVPDNLFNTYWLPYFKELYHPDTRTMSLKVNLTAGDISGFNLYDTVIIKNQKFRVNKINYNPNELATVEFILVP